jgi:DNA modification methylase
MMERVQKIAEANLKLTERLVQVTETQTEEWVQPEAWPTPRSDADVMDYGRFLAGKVPAAPGSGIDPDDGHPSLYPFQQAIVRWAVRRGRAAVFADCGLGKTRMQLDWARQIGGDILIVAPLAVEEQTIAEAQLMGLDVRRVEDRPGDLCITNYERLHKLTPSDFRGIVLDESSILKSIDGKTRTRLLTDWTCVPYRLCCTATPAPNDISELANHSEFLGIMARPEMLASFFVHDENTWRMKGHAKERFWEWLTTWALYVRKPSTIGYSDDGFILPPLTIRDRVVSIEAAISGELFPHLAKGIQGRSEARRASIDGRVEAAADEIAAHPADQFLIWCGLNDEGRRMADALGDVGVLVEGADTDEHKIQAVRRWRSGEVRVLICKAAMFGFGLNFQHCHRMIFLGIGDSYEQYYQSLRRCWRFGQQHPVDAVIVVSEAESVIPENVRRKEHDVNQTMDEVAARMADLETAALRGADRRSEDYREDEATGDGWRMLLGDSTVRLKEIESQSVGLSVFSPPFASLYTYSASDRDLGNSRDYDEFFAHFAYIIAETLRVTQPGRRSCVHVQQVSTTKAVHGVIGWRDFRADTVRAFMDAGWVYDGEVVIDKDPQAQAIRTKSKALMFVQKNKDSAWSRPAMADYILLFRAPGENAEPVKTDVSNEEWILWARPIWYGIRETKTLNAAEATTDKDEKHIAPLQLETIERCVRLWSNRGDLVLSPFAGIGSEGYVALQHDRRFVGVELKPEYWRQAVRNLHAARMQTALFGRVCHPFTPENGDG